jgi:hypothetical protein
MLTEVTRAFGEVYGLGVTTRPERQTVSLDPSLLAPFVGQYAVVQRSDTIVMDVSAEGGALSMYNNLGKRRMRLWPEAPDTFFDANSGNTYVFERDSVTGAVRAMRIGRTPAAPRAIKR